MCKGLRWRVSREAKWDSFLLLSKRSSQYARINETAPAVLVLLLCILLVSQHFYFSSWLVFFTSSYEYFVLVANTSGEMQNASISCSI